MHLGSEGWNVSRQKANKCKQTNTRSIKQPTHFCNAWLSQYLLLHLVTLAASYNVHVFLGSTISGWQMNLANTHPLLHAKTYRSGLGSYHIKALIFQRFTRTINTHTWQHTQSWSTNSRLFKTASFILMSSHTQCIQVGISEFPVSSCFVQKYIYKIKS